MISGGGGGSRRSGLPESEWLERAPAVTVRMYRASLILQARKRVSPPLPVRGSALRMRPCRVDGTKLSGAGREGGAPPAGSVSE